MDGQTWLLIGVSAVAGLGLGALILLRSSWWRVRMYALHIKQAFDRHKLQEKAQAVQALGANPNPVFVKKPLRDLIAAYQELIADLEKVKVPEKAREVHEATLNMHRESLHLYQMASVGGFRQKALVEKQRKLQQMERNLTQKMEQLYGPMKEPPKGGLMGKFFAMLQKRSAR